MIDGCNKALGFWILLQYNRLQDFTDSLGGWSSKDSWNSALHALLSTCRYGTQYLGDKQIIDIKGELDRQAGYPDLLLSHG
jgi:hypothetical protein